MGSKWRLKIEILFFCLIIFAGCSIKDTVKNGSGEEALRERVAMYWGHKIKEELDKSYVYEDPYYRNKVSMVNYIKEYNTRVVKWLSASTQSVNIKDDTALVDVKLRVRVRPPQMKATEYDSLLQEKWVKVDGIWYHVPGTIESRAVN